MPKFAYVGVTKDGRKVNGEMTADTSDEVRRRLHTLGTMATKVRTSEPGASREMGIFYTNEQGKLEVNLIPPSVGLKDLVDFSKKLSVMIDAGIGIVPILNVLQNQTSNIKMKRTIRSLREDVEKGVDLSKAMSKHGDVFDNLFVQVVAAGSASGQLDVMLRRLNLYIEKSNKLRRQLVGALTYPAIVIGIAILVVIVMLVWVVPVLATAFTDSGKPLPFLTRIVVDASSFVINYGLHMFAGFMFSFVMFKKWKKTEKGKRVIDKAVLRLPILHEVVTKVCLARFSTSMSTLISSGIAMLEALKTCGSTVGNSILEDEIDKIRIQVSQGKGLAEPMANCKWFPPIVASMVAVGEQTGQIDHMFEKIAVFFEEEVDATISAALKILEPILIVGIAGVVLFILVALYLPIFDLSSVTGGG